MKRKISIYFCFFLIFINIPNGNLFKIYSYIRQRILIGTIKPEVKNICFPLQYKIENYISNYRKNISISLLNTNGEFIVDINGDLARIPASNQKILSSAFSLDNLGPYYTLNTYLKLLSEGELYIDASGDPDFDINQLRKLISVLKKRNTNPGQNIPIIIKNENPKQWWPSSWSLSDRKEVYGAPISRYSIASNTSVKASTNPVMNFSDEVKTALRNKNISNKYYIKKVSHAYPVDYIATLNTISSAPLYVLLNLINSESHNFTSEVVFRHSLDNWSHDFPNRKYSNWLKKQNFNSNKFVLQDASGLSRDNKVTTFGLSQFLRRMKFNRYSNYYFSSFSILGVRGSLSKVNAPINLNGNILAKSGTLNNVKSVSGIILDKNLIFSIIVNNMDNSLKSIIEILSMIDKDKSCS